MVYYSYYISIVLYRDNIIYYIMWIYCLFIILCIIYEKTTYLFEIFKFSVEKLVYR